MIKLLSSSPLNREIIPNPWLTFINLYEIPCRVGAMAMAIGGVGETGTDERAAICQAHEQRWKALIDGSPIASVISNPRIKDNPIIACNEAFMELTGYSESEIVGRNCRFLAGPATEPWLTDSIRDGVRRHAPVLVEILNYKSDGTPFRNAVLVAPIFDDDGELEFFLGSQVELASDSPTTYANRRIAAAVAVKALSKRQREVLAEMASGHLNKQIAFRLGLHEQTVKMHRAMVMERLGVATAADAIRIAVEAGL